MEQVFWSEYSLILTIYEGFNDQVIVLKGWSVTIGIAALIAAYTKPVVSNSRIGVLLAAGSAVPFWLTETLWKLHQNGYLLRIEELEACAAKNFAGCKVMQSNLAWTSEYHSETLLTWFWIAILPHVLLPHAALLFAGIVLAIYWPPMSDSRVHK